MSIVLSRCGRLSQVRLGHLAHGHYKLTITIVRNGRTIVLLREPFVLR